MSLVLWQTVKMARRIAKTDPMLGYELEQSAVAVVNPGAKSFEKDLANTVSTLEGLEKELEAALDDIDSMDAKEFAGWFDDAVEAEEEQLRQMLKKASTTAGFKDFFKKFKRKPKEEKKEKPPEAKDDPDAKANEPSYQMDEQSMDEFVEGKKEWKDPGHYIEEETKENKEFLKGVSDVLADMDKVRDKPSRDAVQDVLKRVKDLIGKGRAMMKGAREHLKKPDTKVEITEEGREEGKPAGGKRKLAPEDLERLVDHYTDMLKESLGDPGKTVKYLKDLFRDVGPAIHEERAEIAAVRKKMAIMLVHLANMNYELRPRLLPVIHRLAGLKTPSR